MKKILLSMTAICAAVSVNAQLDTITEFFTGTPTMYTVSPANGGGYVSGNNGYGDISKYQRFDVTHGLNQTGLMTGVLIWVGAKDDAGGSFSVKVRDFAGGVLGTVLATETFTLASVDTSAAGINVAEGAVGYNLAVTFATPVPFNSSSDYVVGIELPTTTGDTIATVMNTDGDFADAATHTLEQWNDGTVHYFGDAANWGLMTALAIFPTVNYLGATLTENSIEVSTYPNPTNDVLNIKVTGTATGISILSLDGKVISTQTMNGSSAVVNVSDLETGAYFYQVTAENGSVVTNTFMKM